MKNKDLEHQIKNYIKNKIFHNFLQVYEYIKMAIWYINFALTCNFRQLLAVCSHAPDRSPKYFFSNRLSRTACHLQLKHVMLQSRAQAVAAFFASLLRGASVSATAVGYGIGVERSRGDRSFA